MKHYIDEKGKVYGYKPDDIEVREMTDAEFQAYKTAQEPPPLDPVLSAAIAKRDAMLAATDWYAIRASEPGGKPIPDTVLEYRQALREIDKQPGWPDAVNWPVLSA